MQDIDWEKKIEGMPDNAPPKIAPDAPVRIGFRQYAEPATRVGPADAELLYDRVIVFRSK